MAKNTHTATVSDQAISVQGVKGPVTINKTSIIVNGSDGKPIPFRLDDPQLIKRLEDHGENLGQLKQLFIGQMMDMGKLLIGVEKLLKQDPQPSDIPHLLRNGSRTFRQKLLGEDGRFHNLEISEPILGFYNDVKDQEKNYKIQEWLLKSWGEKKQPNVLLIGPEGMGKTVSLIYMWEYWDLLWERKKLEQRNQELKQVTNRLQERLKDLKQYLDKTGKAFPKEEELTIPIYIPLSQYNREPREVQEKFITHYIATNYLGVSILENALENALKGWLEKTVVQDRPRAPKMLLMLDGLNEITADITPLLIDLSETWVPLSKKGGFQIVATSRYKSSHTFAEDFMAGIKLPLPKECILDYVIEKGLKTVIDYPTADPSLNDLLQIPMMLSLYVGVLGERVEMGEGLGSEFKSKINSTPELIWNYLLSGLAKFELANVKDSETSVKGHFLVQYLLPCIAWEMEQRQVLEIEEGELEQIINAIYLRFLEPGFFKAFSHRKHIKRYRKHISALQIGELPLVEEINRFENLLGEFTNELYPVAKEGLTLRFRHHSFQEFFAAKHLINEINLSLEKGEIPSVLKERILPESMQQMIGEMLGEQYNRPELVPEGKTWEEYAKDTSLVHTMNLCRGEFDLAELGYTVLNVLSIWKKVRGTFAGADFSNLNLYGFDFNNITCSQKTKAGEEVFSQWHNSRLSPKQWFPQGHLKEVNKVRVSPDGKIVATASKDCTIKLWSASTQQYLRTLQTAHGHGAEVVCIDFSPDESTLVSGAADHKLIEWSVETGQCLQVYRGHTASVRGVAYHPSQALILSASEDGTVREWSTETGKCHLTHDLSEFGMIQSICMVKDGESFLVGTELGNILEIRTGTDQRMNSYSQSNTLALSASPCGKKFLGLSVEGRKSKDPEWRILEWSLEASMVVLRVYSFYDAPKIKTIPKFVDITYNPSGEHLIVAGLGDNLFESMVRNSSDKETCGATQTFVSHVRRAVSVAYHPDGEQFFSASYDGSAKKWTSSNGQVLHSFSPGVSPYNTILEVPNSPFLLACAENGNIHKWDISGDSPIRTQIIQNPSPAYTMGTYQGRHGVRIVTAGVLEDHRIWTLEGEQLLQMNLGKDTTTSLSIHPVTKKIISVNVNGELNLWSFEETNKENEPLRSNPFIDEYPSQGLGSISGVKFSPIAGDNRFAVCYKKEGQIRIWEIGETHDATKPLEKEFAHGKSFQVEKNGEETEEEVIVYSFDFDGTHILTAGNDGIIKECEVKTGKENILCRMGNPINKEIYPITFVSYGPNSDSILVGVKVTNNLYEIPIVKSEEGERKALESKVKTFPDHQAYPLQASFSQDGKAIYSVGQDSLLIKWDRISNQKQWIIKNVPGLMVNGLDFEKVYWTEPLTDEEYEMLKTYQANL